MLPNMHYLALAAMAASFFINSPQAAPQDPPKIDVPPILERIAFCESRGRHFDENGEVLLGENKFDIGKYQINSLHWQESAEKLGYDIYTEEGNKNMALELYRRYGAMPWKSSKKCWGKENK